MLKKICLGITALFGCATLSFAQVGIGTTTPSPNAVLDVTSSSKGLLLPRLTDSWINSLQGPEGMIAYNYDTRSFMGYTSADAISITANIPGGAIPISVSSSVSQTYTAPSTFQLRDFGFNFKLSAQTTALTLNIYLGAGTTGTLLGTGSCIIPAGTGGFSYINVAAGNVVLTAGLNYTFTLTPDHSCAVVGYTNNPYSGGYLISGTNNLPAYDLSFEVRAQGASSWSPLVSQNRLADLGDIVNTTTSQSIAGVKAFSDTIIAAKGIKTPLTGTANMLAAAFGNVFSNATNVINSSSGNCAITHSLGTGIYSITFQNFPAGTDFGTLPVSLSLYAAAPGFVTWSGNTNGITITTFNIAGSPADRGFSFVLFKP